MRPDDDGLNHWSDYDVWDDCPADDPTGGAVVWAVLALVLSPFALFFILRALLS
jgi:hypothetical protein